MKLTPDGGVKILDFGLAKALEVNGNATTLPKPVERTGTGVALGTAPYMSPEQARGEPVSKRTDIWALGCVLYEMLSGRRAFPGATWSDSIAAVLEREPEWSFVPKETPPSLHRILRRCLQKVQNERLRDFADTKLELKDLLAETTPGLTRRTPVRSWKAALGITSVLATLGAFIVLRKPLAPPTDIRQPRFQLGFPLGVKLDFAPSSSLAISREGNRIAFVGCDDVCKLYVRDRSELNFRPLLGTEGGIGPFFSPDGRWLGFGAQGKLKKIDLEHDTVVTLTNAESLRGASWGEDGTIVFSEGNTGLLRVSSDGGKADEVTELESGEYGHRWPEILPGGKAILFGILNMTGRVDMAVLDLTNDTKKTLIENAGCPKYLLNGNVLFGRDGLLYAAPFDAKRLEIRGPPVPVLDGIAMWSSPSIINTSGGVVGYDIARDGTLVFTPREARVPNERMLVSLDRKGTWENVSQLGRAYFNPLFSPDGRLIAVAVQTDAHAWGAFVLDIRSKAWTRVNVAETSNAGSEQFAAWMPVGDRLVLSVFREVLLVAINDSAVPERFAHAVWPWGTSVSPDGNALLTSELARPGDWDILRLALTSGSSPEQWLATPSEEAGPTFSPEGEWVAYQSNDSGRYEIYVRSYSGNSVRQQVSTQGGEQAR